MHYLGCRKVFLLGVDFGMDPEHSDQDQVGNYAFNQGRTDKDCRKNNKKYAVTHKMLEILQPIFLKAGYEVYNCNPNSRLTVFPFVTLERALKMVT